MPRRLISLSLWIVLALGVVACRGCVLPDRNLEREVTASEVVGTWRMTPESLKLLERDGFRPAPGQSYTMTFTADGAAEYASVEYIHNRTYATLSGRWELLHNPKGLDERRANVLELELKQRGESTSCFVDWGFDEVDGKLRLWSYLGDPDSWEFVEYTRDD